jgi:hypothetical protein
MACAGLSCLKGARDNALAGLRAAETIQIRKFAIPYQSSMIVTLSIMAMAGYIAFVQRRRHSNLRHLTIIPNVYTSLY